MTYKTAFWIILGVSVLFITCGPSGRVSADTWEDGEWPFTVGNGRLQCFKGPMVFFFTDDGKVWPLNGPAMSNFKRFTYGQPDVQPIWKGDPQVPGARISMGPMLKYGLSLCRE